MIPPSNSLPQVQAFIYDERLGHSHWVDAIHRKRSMKTLLAYCQKKDSFRRMGRLPILQDRARTDREPASLFSAAALRQSEIRNPK